MLFAYPPPVVQDNWLHTCMRNIVQNVHRLVTRGDALPAWPGIVPADRRPRLQTRTALADRVTEYAAALATLTPTEQKTVLNALSEQNDIPELLTCISNCHSMDTLPTAIRKPAVKLFETAFDLLTDLGTRDAHYSRIYRGIPAKVCPFCGDERFVAPRAPREEYDHYLDRNRYPFAGANLRNLVPMGHTCNTQYKKSTDMLMVGGSRCRVFDPYVQLNVSLSLLSSVPFPTRGQIIPKWVIEFNPMVPEVDTWDSVFKIRERLERDVLNAHFWDWIGYFVGYCDREHYNRHDMPSLLAALNNYIGMTTEWGFTQRGFVQKAMFQMLHDQCVRGNQRVCRFLANTRAIQRARSAPP